MSINCVHDLLLIAAVQKGNDVALILQKRLTGKILCTLSTGWATPQFYMVVLWNFVLVQNVVQKQYLKMIPN